MDKSVILCVDDEPVVLTGLRDQIIRYVGDRYMVEVAESGEEALEVLTDLLDEGTEVPLIISDQIMPGMKGDELLGRVHARHPQALKIFLTGQADAVAVGNAVNSANLYRYISKPWDEADFKLTITEALRSYDQEKELSKKQKLLEIALEQERSARDALRIANRELEARVRERTADLEKARDAAEIANRAKTEFLANMSHEIRTPMNAVIGYTELLDGLITDPVQRKHLDSIKAAGRGLLSIINDILDLSKIEAGKMDIQYEPVHIDALVNEIQWLFSLKIDQKNLELIVDMDEQLPEIILLDEVRLRQILFNLVGNAVKFTEKGTVKLALSPMSSPEQKAIDLLITVEDTGIGIPEDEQEKIFESFSQQQGQSTRKFGGTGLGLTITKRLVEMMGGDVRVRSQPGQGSVFEVRFYGIAVDTTSAGIHAGDRENDHPVRRVFEDATVLVVDDDASGRLLIRDYLKAGNLSVIEAENGKEALAAAAKYLPDLILMELRLPLMNGYEAIQRLQADDALKTIPIIVISTPLPEAVDEEAWEYGFDGWLEKPVSGPALLKEAGRFLKYSRQ